MNGKKGSVKIDIPPSMAVNPEFAMKINKSDGLYSIKECVQRVCQFAKEDTDRVTFALKVGLAVLLVSLLILIQPTYEIFGDSIIWSILTVAIMFEYTVGATFNKGFNRALGSLLAGIIAIVVIQVAISAGHVGEPCVIGVSIFIVGSVTSFMKLWPSFVPYEYGFRVTLFTYCLIIVSGYRMGNPIHVAMDRLYSIAIGGIVAVLVNVLICPIWAGEQLHKELVKNFNTVADALEECVNKYLKDEGIKKPAFATQVSDEFPDEPAFKKCRATLNSSAKLDSLANSAKWEPPHGRFKHFFYPWPEYVKVGAVLRHCAYEVMALHGCLHSEIQAPYILRIAFLTEILQTTNEAAELLRSLAKDISDMSHNIHRNLLKRVHSTTERLQRSIDIHSYLLTSSRDSFESHMNPTQKFVNNFSFNLEGFTSSTQADFKPPPLTTENADPSQETKRRQRRLYSWPSREVDDFEDNCESGMIPRMQAFESTTTLSLATFTSLVIEFVARLDHLVDAVDELAKMAKFKEEVKG